MKNFSRIIFLLLLISAAANAQSDTLKTSLSEIVVSANKTQTPYYSLASSVYVITSEEISSRQLTNVVDVLREVPGLSISQQGGSGMLAYVNIRGGNTNHALVVIDGAEMNDASSPNNAFDFSALNTNDIERIEIVRGPQSTLYGSDAVSGVINIFTKHGGSKPHYSFKGEGGSYGYYRGNISASGNYGFVNYFLSASHSGNSGVSTADSQFGNNEKDGYSNSSITSNLNFDLLKNLNFNLLYKFTKYNGDLDQNEKLGDDPNYTTRTEEQLFKGGFNLDLYEGKWQQQLNASFVKRFRNATDDTDPVHPQMWSDNYYNTQRLKLEWQNNFSFYENHLISVGLETETEKANTSSMGVSSWGPNASVFPSQSINTTGIYLQDQVNIQNAFFTSLGFRIDNNEKFGTVATFRIAPAYYIVSTGTKIKATYGTGFKAPSLFYLFDPSYGNPDLKPEKSLGWDLGFDQELFEGKIRFGITYFNLDFKDMFAFGPDFREINIAEASSNGLEVTASLINLNGITINANYTFNKTKDEYSSSEDFNQQLLRRPENRFFVNANYKPNEALNFNAQLRYEGERYDKDFSTFPFQRVKMASYYLVNLSAAYKLLDYLTLNARVENLFDKKYEDVLYYGTMGRSFYTGIGINL